MWYVNSVLTNPLIQVYALDTNSEVLLVFSVPTNQESKEFTNSWPGRHHYLYHDSLDQCGWRLDFLLQEQLSLDPVSLLHQMVPRQHCQGFMRQIPVMKRKTNSCKYQNWKQYSSIPNKHTLAYWLKKSNPPAPPPHLYSFHLDQWWV